jgi:hypothetical protein
MICVYSYGYVERWEIFRVYRVCVLGGWFQVMRKMHAFSIEDLTTTVRAFASLTHHPSAAVLDRLAAEVARRLDQDGLKDELARKMDSALSQHAPSTPPRNLDPSALASTLWAFAHLAHVPPPHAVGSVAAALARQVGRGGRFRV